MNVFLDVLTTVLGIIYIVLEYRASIGLWIVGIILPAIDIYLFWSVGLYGECGMAVYYTVAAVYGYIAWKLAERKALNYPNNETTKQQNHAKISRLPSKSYLPCIVFFLLAWGAVYGILKYFTNSDVTVLDSFTNALSFIGLWALSRKYIEQWFVWIIVDVISCWLYAYKGIPFKAGLYALYVVIEIIGNWKWI